MAFRIQVTYEDLRTFVSRHRGEVDKGQLWVAVERSMGLDEECEVEISLLSDRTSIVVRGAAFGVAHDSSVGTEHHIGIWLVREERERVLRRIWDLLEGNTGPDSRRGQDVSEMPSVQLIPVEDVPEPPRPDARGLEETLTVASFGQLAQAEQMRLALRGKATARGIIIRRKSTPLLRQLLHNPSLTEKEVAEIARTPEMAFDILERIADNTQWMACAPVCVALVENTNTPIPLALRLIPLVDRRELRRIYRKRALRPQLDQAVRRLLQGTKG